jgi:hypothetical protein
LIAASADSVSVTRSYLEPFPRARTAVCRPTRRCRDKRHRKRAGASVSGRRSCRRRSRRSAPPPRAPRRRELLSARHAGRRGGICSSITSSRRSMWARICPIAGHAQLRRSRRSSGIFLRNWTRGGQVNERERIGRAGHQRVEHVPVGCAYWSVGRQPSLIPVSSRIMCGLAASP